jgi:hypothetical protein
MVIMAAVGRASTKVGDLSRDDTERDVAKPWHLEASSQGVSRWMSVSVGPSMAPPDFHEEELEQSGRDMDA